MTIQEATEIVTPIYEKYKTQLELDGPVGFQIMMRPLSRRGRSINWVDEPIVGFKIYDADSQHGHKIEIPQTMSVTQFKEYCRVKYEVEIRDEKIRRILK